jgi:hypothetical protein
MDAAATAERRLNHIIYIVPTYTFVQWIQLPFPSIPLLQEASSDQRSTNHIVGQIVYLKMITMLKVHISGKGNEATFVHMTVLG